MSNLLDDLLNIVGAIILITTFTVKVEWPATIAFLIIAVVGYTLVYTVIHGGVWVMETISSKK